MQCDFRRNGDKVICTREGCRFSLPYIEGISVESYNALCKVDRPTFNRDRKPKPCTESKIPSKGGCPYLLDATDETTRFFGCGCGGQKANGIETTVFICELYGRCSPFARKPSKNFKGKLMSDDSVSRCVDCPENPKNQSS